MDRYLSRDHAKAFADPNGPARAACREGRRPSRLAPALVAGFLLIVVPSVGLAQAGRHGQPVAQAEYRTGAVTANNGTALSIDGRAYRLHPSVTVTDEEGSVYAVPDLKRGALIKFHLRNRKIDQIIWILPR